MMILSILLQRLRESRISLALFTFSVSVLVAAIFYVALSVESLLADYSAIASVHATLDGLAATRNAVEAQVNALRMYVLTGNAMSLADYRNAGRDISGNLADLHGLAGGNSPVLLRIKQLEDAISKQSALSEHVAETYQRGQIDSARQLLVQEDTKLRTLDRIRTSISAFESMERTSLANSADSANSSLRFAILAGSVGLALYFLVQCVVFARMDKESEKRRGSDTSLLNANAELESSLERLQQLNSMTRAISQFGNLLQNCRALTEAIDLTARQVRLLLPEVSVDIGLFDELRKVVDVRRWNGRDDAETDPIQILMMPQECWGLRMGKPYTYVRGGYAPRCEHLRPEVVHSLCIPVLGQEETRGVMSLYTERPVASVADDWEIAQNIAERLAPALANLKLQESLRIQSLRDALTGLFNRRYLDESLPREFARACRHNLPISALMLDIDHFKQFNDENGHDGGDLVLASFGQLLARSVRSEDVACRFGGEEFTLVLAGANYEFALQRAEEIRRATQRIRVISHGQVLGPITASIGVASFPAHGASLEEVLSAADAALYLAKNSGRDRVVGAAKLELPDAYAGSAPNPPATAALAEAEVKP